MKHRHKTTVKWFARKANRAIRKARRSMLRANDIDRLDNRVEERHRHGRKWDWY